jgi:hypothetical protein
MKITLHLLDDDRPTGPRIAKIDQWSGRALCIPRDDLGDIQKYKELDGPCLYFLVAQVGSGKAPRVYVGEADGFRERIKSHVATKPWWTSLVVFFSTDESLTKTGIQYLESSCVALLRAAGWCQLENGNAPELPSIPKEDVGGLELFRRNLTVIMPVLGYNLFAAAPASASSKEGAVERPEPVPGKNFDTIVCPARDEGFESAFMGQRAWWALRIRETNLPKIRYIAIYRVAPTSAITHYGEVDRIEPYTGSDEPEGKYKIFLKGGAVELERPVGLGKNVNLKPQGIKYACLGDILRATTLEDVFKK